MNTKNQKLLKKIARIASKAVLHEKVLVDEVDLRHLLDLAKKYVYKDVVTPR